MALEHSVCEMRNLIGQLEDTKFSRSESLLPLGRRTLHVESLPLRACSSGHSY